MKSHHVIDYPGLGVTILFLHSTHMSMKFVAVKIFKIPIIVGILKFITCTNDIINSEEQVMPIFIKMKLLSYPYPLRPVLTSDLCIKIHTFTSKVSNLLKLRQVIKGTGCL